jgi:hypothetical protein
MTCPLDFLNSLPEALREEARVLRLNNRNLADFGDIVPLEDDDEWERDLDHRQARKQNKNKANLKKKMKQVLDVSQLKRLNKVDDNILENLFKFLYTPTTIRSDYLFTLISSLSFNPNNESKLLDLILFVLKTPNLDKLISQKIQISNYQNLRKNSDTNNSNNFGNAQLNKKEVPPLTTYLYGNKIDNYSTTYELVSKDL